MIHAKSIAVWTAGAILALAGLATDAHMDPTPNHSAAHKLFRRQLQQAATACEPHVAEHLAKTAAAARLRKRATTHYSAIQNTTCVLMPEVTEGPYWIDNEVIRQNITEDQKGVPLLLDIGVMNLATCTPLAGAWVEIWHANATGFYSGYTGLGVSSAGGGGTGGQSGSVGGAMPTPRARRSIEERQTHASLTDTLNFARGVQQANDAGLAEFITFVPGVYTGRTAHIHMKVHTDLTVDSDGTYSGGKVVHIGQLFLSAAIKSEIYSTSFYPSSAVNGMTNEQDSIFLEESANGNYPILNIAKVGSSVSDGLVGYLTVGVLPSFTVAASTAPAYNASASASSSSSSTSGSGSSSSGTSGIYGTSSPFTASVFILSLLCGAALFLRVN